MTKKTISRTVQEARRHHQAGRLKEAEALYRKALQERPNDSEALHLLGVLAYQCRQPGPAVELIRKAIAADGKVADYHNNLGLALQAANDTEAAMASYRAALELRPNYPEAYNNLGGAYGKLRRFEEAVACFQKALRIQPDYANAYNNLGNVYLEQGLQQEALASFEKAAKGLPGNFQLYLTMGTLARDLRHYDESRSHLTKALKLQPSSAEALNTLGTVLNAQGNIEEAIDCYRKALSIKPDYAKALNNLGNVLQKKGSFDEALECFNRAVELEPDSAVTYFNAGNILKEKKSFPEAIAYYSKALKLKPDYPAALCNRHHLMQQTCLWQGLDESFERITEALKQGAHDLAPFSFICMPGTGRQQLACAVQWATDKYSPITDMRGTLNFSFKRKPHDKIRLGYVSSDFKYHATAHLVAELFELHDRSMFEVFGYFCNEDDGSEMYNRLRRAFDSCVDIKDLSHVQAAKRVYNDGIDILIDLKGYTLNSKTELFALRPAPLQVSFLGYPGTMGAGFIDYLVTDDFICPPGSEEFYSEKLVYMPQSYQINDRKRRIAEEVPSRSECGLPDEGFVWCCFNNNYKVTPHVFEIWMRLLKAIPGSVLWLLNDNETALKNLKMEASQRGVDDSRLVFAPRESTDRHLARHIHADLFLDTFPVNAHTTASDALWAGLPVLTCSGETFISRVAGSLLRATGLEELITYSLKDYEEKALSLANNAGKLKSLRDRLSMGRMTAPLFDSAAYTKGLEDAYRQIVEIYNQGGGPGPVRVKAAS